MAQGKLFQQIHFAKSVHSYFGISSLALGIVNVTAQFLNAWDLCVVPGLDCRMLPTNIFPEIFFQLVWGVSIGELLFFKVIPIFIVVLSLVGLVVDQKKIFSISGLALMYISLFISLYGSLYIIFHS